MLSYVLFIINYYITEKGLIDASLRSIGPFYIVVNIECEFVL